MALPQPLNYGTFVGDPSADNIFYLFQGIDTNLKSLDSTPLDSVAMAQVNAAAVAAVGPAIAALGLGALAYKGTINNVDWSGTALALANGGTGATTQNQARINLGLAIGSNVQAWDADLDAVAALTTAPYGLSLLTQASASAAKTALALATVASSGSATDITTGTLPNAQVSATLTPDKAFRQGNVLGTVSQSAGVPTGALIESGTNANGRYVRFADGTQICTQTGFGVTCTTASGNVFVSASSTWTFPAAFVASAAVHGGLTTITRWLGTSGGSTSVGFQQYSAVSSGSTETVILFAVGRWF